MDISEVIEAAKEKNSLKSDRALGRAIGITSAAMVRIKSGFGLPSDDNMIKLGELAGIDRAQSLLLLNIWRSQGETKSTYSDILRRLTATAATLCFVMAIGMTPANAMVSGSGILHYVKDTVYYGNYWQNQERGVIPQIS